MSLMKPIHEVYLHDNYMVPLLVMTHDFNENKTQHIQFY